MAKQDNSFRLSKGYINLESGTFTAKNDEHIYLCITKGTLRVTFMDDTFNDIVAPSGSAYSFSWADRSNNRGVKSIEIISGMFHIGE